MSDKRIVVTKDKSVDRSGNTITKITTIESEKNNYGDHTIITNVVIKITDKNGKILKTKSKSRKTFVRAPRWYDHVINMCSFKTEY